MAPQLRPRRTFPKNCFRLEWFDILLKKPLSIPLNQPTVTIGLKGRNTWNIPVEAFEVDGLKESLPLWDGPLVTLTYDVETHSWFSKRHQPQWFNCSGLSPEWVSDMFPHLRHLLGAMEYPTVPLEVGATLDVHLCREIHADRKEDYGSITAVLVDTRPSCPATANSPSQQLFTDKLASLPAIPLAIIASYLGPYDCVKNFCTISPVILQKLRGVRLSWPTLCLLPLREGMSSRVKTLEAPLDCLRAAKMADVHAVTSFWLGEGPVWKEPCVKLLMPHVRRLVLETKLEEMHLASVWFDQRTLGSAECTPAPMPSQSTLKRLTVHHGKACNDEDRRITCHDFWRDFASYCLQLPQDTEVSLCCPVTLKCGDQVNSNDGRHGTDEREDSPWALHKCREYGDPFELVQMPRVKEVSWLVCNCPSSIPLKAFTNLQRMHLDLVGRGPTSHVREASEGSRYERVAAELEQASLLQLKKVSFRSIGMLRMRRVLEATARAAPNVEFFGWEAARVEVGPTVPWQDNLGDLLAMASLMDSLPVIENFRSMRRLEITFRPCVHHLGPLLGLCLNIPTQVEQTVLKNIKCSDPAASVIQAAAGRLIAHNRRVTLEAFDGSGLGRITYPLTESFDGGHDVPQFYSLIVCTAPET